MCGPRGLDGRHEHSVSQQRRRDIHRCVREVGYSRSPGRDTRSPQCRTTSTTTGGRTFTSRWIRQPSILFKNNHDGTFTDIAVVAGGAYSEDGHEQAGMGVAVGDYDCDGWFDIFKTNFADDTSNLYHNNGDGTFIDTGFSAGIAINSRYVAWGCGFIDYDNDGWADLMQINGHVYPEIAGHDVGQTYKNPRIVYQNLGNGAFQGCFRDDGTGHQRALLQSGRGFWRL